MGVNNIPTKGGPVGHNGPAILPVPADVIEMTPAPWRTPWTLQQVAVLGPGESHLMPDATREGRQSQTLGVISTPTRGR